LLAQGILPAGLEGRGEVVPHPVGHVGAAARRPGTSWPRRRPARISGMPSSVIRVLRLCLRPLAAIVTSRRANL
jgi:hypothetical protein